MVVTFQHFITTLTQRYQASGSILTAQAQKEIDFVVEAIRSSQGENSLCRASTESIERAVIDAAKLGVSLDPSLGLASLKTINPLGADGIECVLDLTLEGVVDAFSRVDGMSLESLQPAYLHSRLAWRGDLMNASVPIGIRSEQVNDTIIGAFCVIKMDNGDQLPTTINQAELFRLAELSGDQAEALSAKFVLRHTLKRALKTLVAPVDSQLGRLQQAVREIDSQLFKAKPKAEQHSLFSPMSDAVLQRRYRVAG